MNRLVKRNIAPVVIITMLLLLQLSGCVGKVYNEKSYASPEDSAQVSTTQSVAQMPPEKITYEQTPASTDGSARESTTQSENAQTTPTTEPQVTTPDFSYNDSSCTPWQLAYVALLQEISNREAPVRAANSKGIYNDDDPLLSDSYSLYDIDKDGTPEIFIKFGECEADYYTKVYTFKNGTAVYVGDFGSEHSCLCTWPKENAVLLDCGQAGYYYMDKISIVNRALVIKEIFSEDVKPDEDYTETDEIVPGAVYIEEYRAVLNLPQDTPLTLPIYNYYSTTSSAGNPSEDGTAQKASITEVLTGNRELYGVSSGRGGGDTGWMTLADYCGACDEYAEQPLKLRKTGWVDLNGDGREECVLLLEEPDQDPGDSDEYAVLSEQDGVVYAYCIKLSGNFEVYRDGVFAVPKYNGSLGISFYKNQCYLYGKSHDPKAPAITWVTNSR